MPCHLSGHIFSSPAAGESQCPGKLGAMPTSCAVRTARSESMRRITISVLLAATGLLLAACGQTEAEKQRQARLVRMTPQERRIQEVLDRRCVKCHMPPDAKKNLDLTDPLNLLPLINSDLIFDDIAVYSVLGKVSPQRVREMINLGMKGEFLEAREILRSLLIDEGLAAEDILRMAYSELMRMQMPEKWKVRISDTVGEVDFRLTQGARPEIQLSTLIAKLALASEDIERR